MSQVAGYLSSVLEQRGPSALPYGEDMKWIVRDHLVELQKVFPSLGISTSDYYAPDGRLLRLLKAEGTIPVHYQGAKYNIPIVIWLTEQYPRSAPLAYVVPTPTMVIKANHTYVDGSGQCSPPILRTWNYPQSNNLVELALQLSQVFGAEPPLYSQPAAAPPAAGGAQAGGARPPPPPVVQPPAAYPSINPQGAAGPGPAPSFNGSQAPPTSDVASHPIWGAAYLASVPGSAASLPRPSGASSYETGASPYPGADVGQGAGSYGGYGGGYPGAAASAGGGSGPGSRPLSGGGARPPPPPPPPPPSITRGEVEGPARKLAVAALRLQLTAVEKAYQDAAARETDDLLNVQRKLLERKGTLQGMVNTLKQEREGTEGVVKEMGHKSQLLQQWLEVNEHKAFLAEQATDQQLMKAWVAVDEQSQLGLEAHAEDLAIEDTILALDRALHAEKAGLTADMYLKQIRALCRRQFFARSLGLKVAAQQAQRPLPQGPPQAHKLGHTLPYPLVHGDSWGWGGQAPPSNVWGGGAPPPPPPPPGQQSGK